jgi:hypothetical protein
MEVLYRWFSFILFLAFVYVWIVLECTGHVGAFCAEYIEPMFPTSKQPYVHGGLNIMAILFSIHVIGAKFSPRK